MVGLALGLLIQGLLFAPFDLPQYGINVTNLSKYATVNMQVERLFQRNIAYRRI